MSQARRQKLEKLKHREDMKSMLVNKFRTRYQGQHNVKSHSIASSVINGEIDRFVETEKLNEANLKRLDARISRGHYRNPDLASPRLDVPLSHRSVLSAQSARIPRSSTAPKSQVRPDSIRSSTVAEEDSDEDEWTQLTKLNQLLHYQEAKKLAEKDRDRKRAVQGDLDRQIEEKKRRIAQEHERSDAYDKMMEDHHRFLEEKEAEKQRRKKEKLLEEKQSRLDQVKQEKYRKKVEKRKILDQEEEIMRELKRQMDEEAKTLQEKRKQEKEYLQKMLEENERWKRQQGLEREREKLEDIKAQEAYAKMLEKQEKDRELAVKAREARTQEFMGRMADTVIKELDQRAVDEARKMKEYETQQEFRERLRDEEKSKRQAQAKEEMKRTLSRQVREKREREAKEKEMDNEQAVIWQKDKMNYEVEEKKLLEKIKRINEDNAKFLEEQMQSKRRKKDRHMDRNEIQLNKKLLVEASEKLGRTLPKSLVESNDILSISGKSVLL